MNDCFFFPWSVIFGCFLTLFINLLAVLQSSTTMYKENDYVPNSTILGVLFFVFCFTKDSLLEYRSIRKLSVPESPSHAPSSSVHVVLRHLLCMSTLSMSSLCLSLFISLSLSLFLSLPQCHCFLDIWPEYSTSLHLFVYFWQFAVCVHSEVIILKEWRDNEIKTMMIMFKK